MPLQRAEGPVFKPHAKRDPSQQGPDVKKSALQQNVKPSRQEGPPQSPVSQNARDPSKKDTKKEHRQDPGKEPKKPKHPDAKHPGAKKKKPGTEGTADAFLNTFDHLKWFRATVKHVCFFNEALRL